MRIFVCKVCGEVYLGRSIPPCCPFCGVENKNLLPPDVWKDENDVELTDISRKNLEDAVKLELSNAAFYKCAADTLTSVEYAKMFKGLFKVEREHASVYQKILKSMEIPDIKETCVDDPLKCLEESAGREERAVNFYAKATAEAVEPRVKYVFEQIRKVELDHIELDKKMKEKYNNK